MTKSVFILIGVPASGKSTFRDKLVIKKPGVVVVSSDDYIEQKAADRGITYDEAFNDHVGDATASVQAAFRQAINRGEPRVLVDRTNLTPKSRKQWLDKARKSGYDLHAIVFHPPSNADEIAEWNRRLRNRPGKTIPRNVLDSMVQSFTLPQPEEGWATVVHLDSWA